MITRPQNSVAFVFYAFSDYKLFKLFNYRLGKIFGTLSLTKYVLICAQYGKVLSDSA